MPMPRVRADVEKTRKTVTDAQAQGGIEALQKPRALRGMPLAQSCRGFALANRRNLRLRAAALYCGSPQAIQARMRVWSLAVDQPPSGMLPLLIFDLIDEMSLTTLE